MFVNSQSGRRGGFTLLELMIVTVILGTLATIAAARYSNLFLKTREAATKGNLGVVRTALSVYYADNQGQYPGDANDLTNNATYIASIPSADLRDHARVATITNASSLTSNDSGGWLYVNDPASLLFGRFFVNCTHTDVKGSLWTAY